MVRAGTAVGRTTDLLNAIDGYARDGGAEYPESNPGDLLAIRYLVEALTRIVQAHPTVAEFAEDFANRGAEALYLIEEE